MILLQKYQKSSVVQEKNRGGNMIKPIKMKGTVLKIGVWMKNLR